MTIDYGIGCKDLLPLGVLIEFWRHAIYLKSHGHHSQSIKILDAGVHSGVEFLLLEIE
jgi:hypothetical protein